MAPFLPVYVGRILLCMRGADLQLNKRQNVPRGNPSVPMSSLVHILSYEEDMTSRVAVVKVYRRGDCLREV